MYNSLMASCSRNFTALKIWDVIIFLILFVGFMNLVGEFCDSVLLSSNLLSLFFFLECVEE